MSGQTMTMREVADLCEVDRTTVLRWIGKIENGALRTEIGAKCTEADEAKKPARFDLREVLAIINAGGKHTLASLLAENAKQPVATLERVATPATLSGSLVRELRITMGPGLATKVILAVAGIPDAFKAPSPVQQTLELEAPKTTTTRFPRLAEIKYPVDHYTAAVVLALIPARIENIAKSLGIFERLDRLEKRHLVEIWCVDKGHRYSFKSEDDIEDMARNIDQSRGVA